MTREEAKRELLFAKREVMADSYIDKAYDMAIKALEQPERKRGRWIMQDNPNMQWYGHWKCDQCGTASFDKDNFCSCCGADMRGEQE